MNDGEKTAGFRPQNCNLLQQIPFPARSAPVAGMLAIEREWPKLVWAYLLV